MFDRLPRLGRPDARPLLRRGFHLVGLLVVITVVLAFAIFAVPQFVGAEHSYVVLSGSMQPTMDPGDVILVDAVGIDAIETGDIITFRDAGGTATTHRVVRVITDGETALQTKGDDNEAADQRLVREAALVGRVMTVGATPVIIPYVGLVIETARTDLGLYALVLVPLTLLVLNEIYLRLADGASKLTDSTLDTHLAANGGGDHPAISHALAEGVPDMVGGVGSGTMSPVTSEVDSGTPGTAVQDLRLTTVVLLLVVPASGWLTLTTWAAPASMLFAGSGVGLALVAAARLGHWRSGGRVGGGGSLSPLDVTLAMGTLAVFVPVSTWVTLRVGSVPAAMMAAGGGVGLFLLGVFRLHVWWTTRTPSADEGARSP